MLRFANDVSDVVFERDHSRYSNVYRLHFFSDISSQGHHTDNVGVDAGSSAIVGAHPIIIGPASIQSAHTPAGDAAHVEVLISGQVAAKGTAGGHIQLVARRSDYTAPVSCEPTLGDVRGSFGRRRCGYYKIVADNVEINAFGRASGNIGVLARANEAILHIW